MSTVFMMFEAAEHNVSSDSVSLIGFVDFNAPNAGQALKTDMLCQGVSIVNSHGDMSRNCTVILLPDHPKDSSLRGLYDEEKSIIESLFGFRQHLETRFVDLFTREPKAEQKSSGRRFSSGRLVVHADSFENNQWLSSELAVCGRPVGRVEGEHGAPTSVLPRASALLLPEGASPESDLKLADRTRPSPEQTSAQKGTARLELLLESLFRNVGKLGPTLI